MTHPNTPVYYTVSTVCQYDGTTSVLAICEDMDAVMYRMKQCYTTCGDEYVINAYHLTTAEDAAVKYNEQLVSRREYQAKEKEKEDKLKEYESMVALEDKLANEEYNEDKIKAYDERIEAAQPLSKLEEEEYNEELDAASYT